MQRWWSRPGRREQRWRTGRGHPRCRSPTPWCRPPAAPGSCRSATSRWAPAARTAAGPAADAWIGPRPGHCGPESGAPWRPPARSGCHAAATPPGSCERPTGAAACEARPPGPPPPAGSSAGTTAAAATTAADRPDRGLGSGRGTGRTSAGRCRSGGRSPPRSARVCLGPSGSQATARSE